MASGIYSKFKYNALAGNFHGTGDTYRVMILTTGHSFNAAHTGSGDVTANEVSSANYSAGGTNLTSPTLSEAVNATWDAADVSWGNVTFTAGHAVLYASTAPNHLICSFDFGGAKAVSAGTFTIQWSAAGILFITG